MVAQVIFKLKAPLEGIDLDLLQKKIPYHQRSSQYRKVAILYDNVPSLDFANLIDQSTVRNPKHVMFLSHDPSSFA
jgi:hypothetical protein